MPPAKPGTGRSLAIRDFVLARCGTERVPDDWLYVYNFETPHRPLPMSLPAGQGKPFQDAMKHLVESMKLSLPQALESYSYRTVVRQLEETFDKERLALLEPLERKATDQGFGLEETSSGLMVTPVPDNDNDGENGRHRTRRKSNKAGATPSAPCKANCRTRCDSCVVWNARRWNAARRSTATPSMWPSATTSTRRAPNIADHQTILDYLDGVRKDLLNQVGGSVVAIEEEGLEEVIDLRRYEVNLFVDNSETEGAPVIVQVNPTYENLFGRFEYEIAGHERDHSLHAHEARRSTSGQRRLPDSGGQRLRPPERYLGIVYAGDALR